MANPSENLINLCRAAVEAHRTVTAQPHTAEGWKPWMDAAETFQAAVTAEAEVTGENRFKLEQATKKAVLHPEESSDG